MTNHAWKLGGSLLTVLSVFAASGCQSTRAAVGSSTSPAGSGTAGAVQPSSQQIAYAEAIARREGSQFGRRLTAGAVQVVRGTQDNPNIGPACESGTVLNILLLGTFPRDMVDGMAPRPGQPPQDLTVRGLTITADGATGKPCLLGDVTGHPHLDAAWTRIAVE